MLAGEAVLYAVLDLVPDPFHLAVLHTHPHSILALGSNAPWGSCLIVYIGHCFLSVVLTPCETRKCLQLKDASFLFFIVFLFDFFHAKSHSGRGRDPIQDVAIFYLSVKNAGWLTDQADHGVCLCLNKTKGLTAHIQWKWFLISGLTLHKHDWIGLASQHMYEKKVWLDISPNIQKMPSWSTELEQAIQLQLSELDLGRTLTSCAKKYFSTTKRHINMFMFFLKNILSIVKQRKISCPAEIFMFLSSEWVVSYPVVVLRNTENTLWCVLLQ